MQVFSYRAMHFSAKRGIAIVLLVTAFLIIFLFNFGLLIFLLVVLSMLKLATLSLTPHKSMLEHLKALYLLSLIHI